MKRVVTKFRSLLHAANPIGAAQPSGSKLPRHSRAQSFLVLNPKGLHSGMQPPT